MYFTSKILNNEITRIYRLAKNVQIMLFKSKLRKCRGRKSKQNPSYVSFPLFLKIFIAWLKFGVPLRPDNYNRKALYHFAKYVGWKKFSKKVNCIETVQFASLENNLNVLFYFIKFKRATIENFWALRGIKWNSK